MSRGWKIFTTAVLTLILLLAGLMLTVTRWLPHLAGIWLPAGTSVALDGRPQWRNGGLFVPDVRYLAGDCPMAVVKDATLQHTSGRWRLHAAGLDIDSDCFNQLPAGENRAAPRSIADWQAMLPAADINIDKVKVTPWQTWAGALTLNLDGSAQRIRYSGEALSLIAELRGQQLDIQSLTLSAPGVEKPVSLAGTVTLPAFPDGLPESGRLHSTLTLSALPTPVAINLAWQRRQGQLSVTQQNDDTPLLALPWQATAEEIRINQGQWRWPYGPQPVSGGISLSLRNWQQGLPATEIVGRLNVLTQGRGGKGNVVLSLGPGHLDFVNSALPFRITGESKLAQLQFYAGLPGDVQGALSDPHILLKPGALLRMKGRLLSTLEVDEARWPLAGVTLSSAGLSGRLQAILTAHDPRRGRFRLHLDGGARDFWPDKGLWRWRYWGDGAIAPLAATWDISGRGRWEDTVIELTSLSTGFDRIAYGSVNVNSPRLTLTAPLRWQRDQKNPLMTGQFRLAAQRTDFSGGGYLPPAALTLAVRGRDPAAFLYSGSLQAQAIGPVRVQGRWNGERLRGQAWWPSQPLSVFQPLLGDLKMKIQSGTLRAQAAFSASDEQGLSAGGHWVVTNGSVRMPDNQINGVDFSLPFRLKAHQWYFGAKGPVSLRIKEIKNQFALHNITADLQGWYPWRARQPLRLSNVAVDVLGGKISMESLQMPQTEAAMLRLSNIDLSEVVAAVKPKQIAMSGKINGALPLWLNHSQWLVKEGWLANSGPLTIRLDKDFADALSQNSIAAGAALDWLRYMEISRSWATLDLDNLGGLTMKAQVEGTSRFSDKNQRVSLNYTQQENLFQLWRSLRFGDNLQSWVEDNANLPQQKEKKDETH
ncbi:YdbH family protein [Erwinia oleae]|uniref:YdbH family protein n=1 Tax=Erwinia oleae TaxID=796334 RepID=UPI0005582EC1|nr:YdbH family protein [Erwinia oleae]